MAANLACAIYARVSTLDKGQDTTNQLRELRQFAEASGWKVTKEYVDHSSGAKAERDELKAMMADASKRKFKVVLVWALDRLTREGVEQTFAYVRQLKEGGIDFISYQEPHFRTTGPVGELLIAIAAWIATQERARISERTKAGMQTARLKGKQIGRPRVTMDHKRVLKLHADGLGVGKIAAELGGVSRETVRRLLRAS